MSLPRNLLSPLTVTRAGAQTVWMGDIQPGVPTTLVVNAIVQPLSGADLVNAPEGQHGKQGVKAYTDAPLLIVNPAAGTKGDTFAWGGRTFEVQRVDAWPVGGLPHWRVYAYQIDQPAEI